MGTSSSAAQLASKLGRAARGIEGATRDGVREAGIVSKAIFVESLPTRSMSGAGRRGGVKLGATFRNPSSKTNPTTIVKYTGPVHLLNNATKRHVIGGRGLRVAKSGRKLSGKKALAFNGVVRGSVNHPGTKGQKFAGAAIRKAAAASAAQVRMAEVRALRRVF